MPVEVDAVPSDETLPASADVVVIGGGIVGVSTAMFLAERGIPVVLCEKGVIAGEQSSRNWGWCRTMGRDPRELPLAMESLRLWRGLNERIGAETGFRQSGTLYICPDQATYAKREAWLPYSRALGHDSRLLRGKAVNDILAGAVGNWTGALYTPSDGVAEPALAAPAIARGARRQGAKIFTNCAARGLETAGGRVSAVVTERGRIACSTAVLAGGSWSTLFCRAENLSLPQLKVKASVLRTAPVSSGPGVAAWGPGLSLRKRMDGGYTVSHGSVIADIVPDSFRYFRQFLPVLRAERAGVSLHFGGAFLEEWRWARKRSLDEPSPYERVRILDPEPETADIAKARANLESAFPAFIGVATLASWAGLIDCTPDILPVISKVDRLPGLVLSTGYSGHGFGIGPGAGRLTADLVTGDTPIVDPAPFRFSRFSDGSDLKVLAGL